MLGPNNQGLNTATTNFSDKSVGESIFKHPTTSVGGAQNHLESMARLLHNEWLSRPENAWAAGDPNHPMNRGFFSLSAEDKAKDLNPIYAAVRTYSDNLPPQERKVFHEAMNKLLERYEDMDRMEARNKSLESQGLARVEEYLPSPQLELKTGQLAYTRDAAGNVERFKIAKIEREDGQYEPEKKGHTTVTYLPVDESGNPKAGAKLLSAEIHDLPFVRPPWLEGGRNPQERLGALRNADLIAPAPKMEAPIKRDLSLDTKKLLKGFDLEKFDVKGVQSHSFPSGEFERLLGENPPNFKKAREILKNYREGLSKDGSFVKDMWGSRPNAVEAPTKRGEALFNKLSLLEEGIKNIEAQQGVKRNLREHVDNMLSGLNKKTGMFMGANAFDRISVGGHLFPKSEFESSLKANPPDLAKAQQILESFTKEIMSDGKLFIDAYSSRPGYADYPKKNTKVSLDQIAELRAELDTLSGE